MANDASLWINGAWAAGSGPEFQSSNPADQSVVWLGCEAVASDVARATASARSAFASWCLKEVSERIEIVKRFSELVNSRGDELATLISRETGKPLWEAKTEVAAVVAKGDLSVDALRQRRSTTSFAQNEQTAVTRYKPFGVIAVLGPFNFPAHLPNGHIAPSLLAGNTLVFKPSEHTPAVGAWMVNRWHEAGLPAGVLNLVQGGRAPARHWPAIRNWTDCCSPAAALEDGPCTNCFRRGLKRCWRWKWEAIIP